MITHIFFDLDNTFYDYKRANDRAINQTLDYMSMQTGIEKKVLFELYENAKKEVKMQQSKNASSHSRLLYFKRLHELIFNETNIRQSMILHNNFWTVFFKNMQIFPSVKKLLLKAKDLNISTIIATNLTTDIQFRKLAALGVDELIDFVVTSEDAGIEKPSEKFVQYLVKVTSFDIDKNKSWYIGDDLKIDTALGITLGSDIFIRKNGEKAVGNDEFTFFSDFNDLFNKLETENL